MKIEREELLELIRRSREKDLDAQEELVRAVQDRVYYHCKKMLKNKEDAEDTTQTVLMTMIASLDKLKEPAAFWAWVNGITANQCKHLLTAPHKEWQIPEDEEGNSMLESVENLDETLVPEKVLDNEETRRMILGLVDELPPEQRMSVLFYYYDEMSVKQIAEAMGHQRRDSEEPAELRAEVYQGRRGGLRAQGRQALRRQPAGAAGLLPAAGGGWYASRSCHSCRRGGPGALPCGQRRCLRRCRRWRRRRGGRGRGFLCRRGSFRGGKSRSGGWESRSRSRHRRQGWDLYEADRRHCGRCHRCGRRAPIRISIPNQPEWRDIASGPLSRHWLGKTTPYGCAGFGMMWKIAGSFGYREQSPRRCL